jgi:ketosteroid isomerase-like protein
MRHPQPAACVVALLLALLTAASAASREFTAKDLAAEEGRFAAYSVKHGMRAAFLEFFAEPSWLLRPEPVDAKTWLRARPDPAIDLDWKSQRTVLAASGDLGFSTGPWLLRSKADPHAPAAHGQFFSVWQKQNNGDWKVFIDHGISHGPTATPDALPATPLVALDLAAQKAGGGVSGDDAERQFIARGSSNYADVITPHTRLLRDGQLPIDGTAAIGDYLKSQEGPWTWTVKLQGTSRAGDFAYAVGNFTWQPKEGAARKGQYVRVWVREASGAAPPHWTLAAEVLTPEPPPKA